MLKTTDDMRRTGQTGGRTGAQADEGSERTSGRTSGRADGRTSGRGRARWADERMGADNGRTGGRVGGGAAGARTGGRGRTGGRRISEGKTPNLTRHLTWPVGNPTWPSSGNCKVTRFTSSITITTGSDTMSCRHHADDVVPSSCR